jgi:hypothetical protein
MAADPERLWRSLDSSLLRKRDVCFGVDEGTMDGERGEKT